MLRISKKRIFDLSISIPVFLFISPILLIFCVSVYIYDKGNPIYVAKRVGLNGKVFRIFKIRTMVIDADKIGGTSTSKSDARILPIGKTIRKLKLDEFAQFLNVINGTMSIVGPRPNTVMDCSYYSNKEKNLLTISPGITDYSSIIFADEGEIISKFKDPDLAYNQLIRPWKSRLGLFYVSKNDLITDFKLILLTFLNFLSRKKTLKLLSRLLIKNGAPTALYDIARRETKLIPTPPPGFNAVIKNL